MRISEDNEKGIAAQPTGEAAPQQPYAPPQILWEEKFVALATGSLNPFLCSPPPPYCGGG